MPHLPSGSPKDGELVFPPVSADHIQNCSYDSWFPKYRSSCIKSRIIPLTPAFVSYLHENGIILADDENTNGPEEEEEWTASGSTKPGPPQDESSDEDEDTEESRLPPNQRFPEIHNLIKEKIAELGGSVAPKLNWSSPKDAKWISPHQNTLKCTSPNDIYLLLKSSSFVSHDLLHAFDDCTGTPTRPFAPVLVLRPFFNPHVALEFRCFVKHRSLIGITQRDLNYYGFLNDLRPQIWRKLKTFFREKLRLTFPDSSFTFDVYIPESHIDDDGLGKVRLIDINPWAPRTDSLLFSWEELLDMEVKKPLLGSVPTQTETEGSGGETTADELDDDAGYEYGADSQPEMRFIEKDDPAAYNFSSTLYSAHKLPKEVVDASLAVRSDICNVINTVQTDAHARSAPLRVPTCRSCSQLFTKASLSYSQNHLHETRTTTIPSSREFRATREELKLPMMPTRGRGNKVTKPSIGSATRRGSRQSSLSNAAQEQLEHFAKEASSTVAQDIPEIDAQISDEVIQDSGLDSPENITTENLLSNGEVMSSMQHTSLQVLNSTEEFQLDHQMHDHSSPMDPTAPTRTAADVAYAVYGDALKVDSALCKKLAAETAQREPTQRRVDQKLNIERRSNVEALLAHITGGQPARPCKNCHKGHGPWTQCVIYDGQMCGSCTNCWFNASGARCTFHENNHPQSQTVYAPVVTTTPASVVTFQPATVAATAAVATLQAMDINSWNISDGTKRLIHQTMGEVASYSKRDRYLARIEAAARELGLRIAEYEDYLRTPEGAAEHQAVMEQEQEQAGAESQHSSQGQEQTQAVDASMGDAPPQEAVLT
ncbi:Cell division cycle protein [Cladobotryum mycophilum]|uniref:Cell division cycle protein n=1 Tax=Cladobotryum mycophilum TaxID=491253 RepID=A0ABR0SAI2_9HYPO